MRTQLIGAATAALFLCPIPALAGGSDSPTPYTVDTTGITLPAGDVFPDNGHINITTTTGDFGIHFESKCTTRTDAECTTKHQAAQYIGQSFIPWSAFTPEPICVTWVQIGHHTAHLGEGGQSPVGPGCGPSVEDAQSEPTPEPEPTQEPTEESTDEPTQEPTQEPTEDPAPTPDPELTNELEPEPERPEKPAPQWYGDKSYDCESGLVTVIDYRADWVWDDGEWVLGPFEYVSESSGPIDQPICDDSSEDPVDEGVGTPIVVDRPQSVDPDPSPSPSTPTPDQQGDDPKSAPTPSAPVDRTVLAETGAEDKLVAIAALLFLGGLTLLTFRGRK